MCILITLNDESYKGLILYLNKTGQKCLLCKNEIQESCTVFKTFVTSSNSTLHYMSMSAFYHLQVEGK